MKQRLYFFIFLILTFKISVIGQSVERIFYSTFSPQDWDIYISKDDGKSIEKLTNHPSLDYDAVISPDGKWVVFTSERSGIPQLYVQAIEGEQSPALLIKSNSFQDQATFSPDGSQLAFVASHEGNSEIYIIPFLPNTIQDISKAINLTKHPGGDFRPSFSPNGKQIAFSSDRGHVIVPHPQFPFARQRIGNIYTIDNNGNNLNRLTDSKYWDGSPIWSTDGNKIIFYSGRTGKNTIFEMNPDGTNQKQLIDFEGPAVSPKYLSNGNFAFTTWHSEQDFKIMQVDKAKNEITSMFSNSPDLMFNVDIHPRGLIVFHGGKYAPNKGVPGNFGFDGDVLAKLPDTLSFGEQKLTIYGVRRAFVAPPQIGNTLLYYDAGDTQSFFDFLKPLGYSVFWLPILIVILFIAGILLGIRNRKKISFWRYLLFSILTLFLGIITGGIFFFVDAINPMPLSTIRLVMGFLTIAFIILGWWQYKRTVKRIEIGITTHRLSKLYSLLFYGLAYFAFFCTVFINQMVNSTLHFYQVDYVTGEKKLLFSFDKEPNTNPANFSVLDSKVTHDGKSFIFTTGSFRANATTQGDIWKYDFETKSVSKLSDSPYNDGFGDFSEDGKMVFRSGSNGNFDIYLKTNNVIENLTNDHHRDNFPAISKQGDNIVFSSDRLRKEGEYKTMDIFLIKLKSDNSWSEPEIISNGKGQNAHAHFSPDGKWVIYTTEEFGINDEQALIQPIIFSPQMYGEIVAYNLKTKERIRLTHNKWEEGTPLWVE
ncbi:MAG: PD40 domain-containing protein [Saprospiraceae bacterium]|nr:PD40 domain-containing protein [Saprospiraceae bacterium]